MNTQEFTNVQKILDQKMDHLINYIWDHKMVDVSNQIRDILWDDINDLLESIVDLIWGVVNWN